MDANALSLTEMPDPEQRASGHFLACCGTDKQNSKTLIQEALNHTPFYYVWITASSMAPTPSKSCFFIHSFSIAFVSRNLKTLPPGPPIKKGRPGGLTTFMYFLKKKLLPSNRNRTKKAAQVRLMATGLLGGVNALMSLELTALVCLWQRTLTLAEVSSKLFLDFF